MISSKKNLSRLVLFVSLVFLISLAGLIFVFQSWMPFMWFLLASGVAGLCWTAFVNRRLIQEFLFMKTTQKGLSMGLTLGLVILILIGVNFIAVKFNKTFDLSQTQSHTLSEQTKKVLDQLDSDLEIKYFYTDGLQTQDQAKRNLTQLVRLFQQYSNKIKFENVEMNSRPKIVELYGAKAGTGEAFLSYHNKISKIDTQFGPNGSQTYTEQELTNSIIKSTRKIFKKVYFLVGHGERSLEEDRDEKALGSLKALLSKKSYQVESLNVLERGLIPEDADVLVIVAPEKDFLKNEMSLIQKYLTSYKPLLLVLGRPVPNSIKIILNEVGIRSDENYIFNILNTPDGPVVSTDQPTVATQFLENNPITTNLVKNHQVIFNRPTSLTVKTPTGVDTLALLQTAPASVALNSVSTTTFQGKPQSYVLMTQTTRPYNLITISDASILSNQYIGQASNTSLVLNAVAALAGEKDLISIAAKDVSTTPLKMNGVSLALFYKYFVVGYIVPLPFLLLLTSLIIWYRRRNA